MPDVKCQTRSTLRLPGLNPGVCSGLILSGALNPDLKIGVWRRRTYQCRHLTNISDISFEIELDI
jgi:hypothetical protein